MSTDTDRGGVVCMECGERFDTVAESIEHHHMDAGYHAPHSEAEGCEICLERVCGWTAQACRHEACTEHPK